MTHNEKDLLLKDLSPRLPYGVILQTDNVFPQKLEGISFDKDTFVIWVSDGGFTLEDMGCKPYLFPLSSMTEEQYKEFYDKYCWSDGGDNFEMDSCSHYYALGKFDWLDKNHFDYRGLIPKGIALDATGKNIY